MNVGERFKHVVDNPWAHRPALRWRGWRFKRGCHKGRDQSPRLARQGSTVSREVETIEAVHARPAERGYRLGLRRLADIGHLRRRGGRA